VWRVCGERASKVAASGDLNKDCLSFLPNYFDVFYTMYRKHTPAMKSTVPCRDEKKNPSHKLRKFSSLMVINVGQIIIRNSLGLVSDFL
jgi:hypothetical protein